MGWPDWIQQTLGYLGADPLEYDTTTLLAPGHNYFPSITQNYGGLMVVLTPPVQARITVAISDGMLTVPPFSQIQDMTAPGQTLIFSLPYPVVASSTPKVAITSSVNQTGESNVAVFGLGQPTPALQGSKLLRSDGRPYPIGQNLAAATVPAVVGVRFLVKFALVNAMAGGAATAGVVKHSIAGTVGGSTASICEASCGTQETTVGTMVFEPEGGLLLDVDTPITFSSFLIGGAASQDGSASVVCYDVVV